MLRVERVRVGACFVSQLANVRAGDFLEKGRLESCLGILVGIVAFKENVGRVKVPQRQDGFHLDKRRAEAVVRPVVAVLVIRRPRVMVVDGKRSYGDRSPKVPARLSLGVIVAKENLRDVLVLERVKCDESLSYVIQLLVKEKVVLEVDPVLGAYARQLVENDVHADSVPGLVGFLPNKADPRELFAHRLAVLVARVVIDDEPVVDRV